MLGTTWENSILFFCFLLFALGAAGIVINQRNFLLSMLCAELMYLGIITSFALYGVFAQDTTAQIYALILIVTAACESAVGLGILISLYRFNRRIDFAAYTQLRG